MSVVIPKLLPKSEVKKGRWQPYLFLGLIVNAGIWSLALVYLKLVPATYSSHSAITVPEEGSSANVNLPNIGATSYQNSDLYSGGSTQDPRENYKFIAESEPVLKVAAEQLNMTLKQFGEPRIKIVVNSAIMEVSFKGKSPEEAQNKSLAFYQAFETRLNRLRVQAVAQRNKGFQSVLGTSQRKLEIAQKRLSNYKASSGLNTGQQVTELSASIEYLRRQKAEILAQQQQASDRLKQLSTDLNISTQQAADAFVLKSDQVFQQNLKDYSETKAGLDILNSKFLPNAPTVVEQEAKLEAAEKAILTRGQFLLGRQVSLTSVKQLNLSGSNSDSAREQLFQQLIVVGAEQKGLQGQAQVLDKQIANFENRLKNLGGQEINLDALKRDLQVAEAVFSSTLAKLDIGKSNVFGSYPLMEIVTEPTLPEEPSWPNEKFVLLGTILCSLFASTGIGLIGLRQRKMSTRE
jgi:uncharacterized protein involved in exopolysaccharide biosynthesis